MPDASKDASNDEAEVRRVVETWHAATRSGDTATVLTLMTDDVIFLVAGAAPFGKTQFAAGADKLKGVHIEPRAHIREVEVSGDLAFCRTDLEVTMTPPGGKPKTRKGPTLSIFRRTAGTWKMCRDANFLVEG